MSTKIGHNKTLAATLFLAPALLFLVIFFIIPVTQSFYFSLTNWDGFSSSYRFSGFENYKYVFTARQTVQVIKNTFYLAIIYIPVLNILSLFLAVIINDCKKLQNVYKSILFFPNLLALAVTGYIFKMILNPSTGILNRVLDSIGLSSITLDWLGNIHTVIPAISLTTIWVCTGFYLVIYLAGIMGIPQDLYEAASIDGASRWQKFQFITFPLLSPSITINVILSTIGILGAFDLPYVMTGGGPAYYSTTIALQIYVYNSKSLQLGNGLVLSVVLCIVSIIITAILFKITTRRNIY
ncbi:MAG: sugar ABC transporter permease [Leucobacter sp.]|nr:sugar ABC transporter permease [Leucobacter sp.]